MFCGQTRPQNRETGALALQTDTVFLVGILNIQLSLVTATIKFFEQNIMQIRYKIDLTISVGSSTHLKQS